MKVYLGCACEDSGISVLAGNDYQTTDSSAMRQLQLSKPWHAYFDFLAHLAIGSSDSAVSHVHPESGWLWPDASKSYSKLTTSS